MNRKILNKLLLCALVLNVASPAFSAAELSSEVLGSELTTSEVSSEDTASEVSSEDTTSEEAIDVDIKGDSGDNDFFIAGDSYIGDENTQINEEVDGAFTVSMFINSAFVSGATITIDAPAGIEVSNIVITNEQTDEVLVEGTDYTLENNVITLTNDFELGTDLAVGYTVKLLNGTSDILGSTDGIYNDHNGNGVLDGNEYYAENPGYDIIVTNDGVTETDNVKFISEIVGGEISVENTEANRKYENGQISGTAAYTITNTGDYAIELRSLRGEFDLVSDNDEYYVYGVYSTNTDIELSVHGSEYMTKEELLKSFDNPTDEYLNPGETIDVKVSYNIDKEMTEANLGKYNFGSWLNFTKHAKAQFTVDTTYANNVFGEDITTPEEIVITTSLYQKEDEVTDGGNETTDGGNETTEDKTTEDKTTEDKTTEDKTTEDKTTEDKTDDSYTQMNNTDDTTATLATTGSTTFATLAILVGALIVAFALKVKVAIK